MDHTVKHDPDFSVRQRKAVKCPACPHLKFCFDNFQISACKEQAPYCALPLIKLSIYDLLIELCLDLPTLDQFFEICFYVFTTPPDQFIRKMIGAGICSVSLEFPRIKEIYDGPGIINICQIAECETVIPVFHFLLPLRHPIFIQC